MADNYSRPWARTPSPSCESGPPSRAARVSGVSVGRSGRWRRSRANISWAMDAGRLGRKCMGFVTAPMWRNSGCGS